MKTNKRLKLTSELHVTIFKNVKYKGEQTPMLILPTFNGGTANSVFYANCVTVSMTRE